MSIDKNDPRLTAFALGELAAEEAAELAAAVEKDAELAAEVDAIRKVADKLKTSLADEPLPKTEVVKPLEPATKPNRFRRRLAFYGSAVAIVLVLLALVQTPSKEAIETARSLSMNHADDEQHPGPSAKDQRNMQQKEFTTEKLAELVEEYNRKMETQHYAEAEIIAKRAVELAPNNRTAQQLLLNAKFVRRHQSNQMIAAKDVGFLDQLGSVDESPIPFDDRLPEKRSELSKNRAKSVDSDTNVNISQVSRENEGEKKSASPKKPRPEIRIEAYAPPAAQTPMDGPAEPVTDGNKIVSVGMEAPKVFSADLDIPFQTVDSSRNRAGPHNTEVNRKNIEAIDDPILKERLLLKKLRSEIKKHPHKPLTSEQIELLARLQADISIADADTNTHNTESYDKITENEFKRVSEHPLSTFSIDVDTASYSMVRKMLSQGRMPVPGAVRLEEMINYFDYSYQPPMDGKPFATHVDAAKCPWNAKHNLVRIGLKGRVIDKKQHAPANLVFLLDVSGSMNQPNKLPLLKDAMKMLVENLNEKDSVAIVVYAGASGLVLPSTPCGDKQKILESLDRLQAGGSTNGGAGIKLAYATAAANYLEKGVNRVILCTDGDFNVGTTNQSELVDTIEKKAKEGVFLTVLGFGMGNYKDSTLEKLADKGNGNYGYVDTHGEAKKLLVEGLSGTLVTIAKDVKIQVEFNPRHVKGYRLLGYENRMLRKEDFNDDTKDAGEIGAGHTVTALYEVIPADTSKEPAKPKVDELKYQKPVEKTDAASSEKTLSQEMLTVKLRYKEPDGEKSKLLEFPVKNQIVEFDGANVDLKFASSVAAFGMILRGSQFKGDADYDKVIRWAKSSLGEDEFGYREEFLKLVRTAKSLGNN